MRRIPDTVKSEIQQDPFYDTCARLNADCRGRITWEHAFLYAGKQINEVWAIIPLCWRHHLGDLLDKRINEYIALSRATEEDLEKYPRTDWAQRYRYVKSYAQEKGFELLTNKLTYDTF